MLVLSGVPCPSDSLGVHCREVGKRGESRAGGMNEMGREKWANRNKGKSLSSLPAKEERGNMRTFTLLNILAFANCYEV